MTKKKLPEDLQKKGRKLLYGEPTDPVVTKVPRSKKAQFKKEVKEKILKQWEVKKEEAKPSKPPRKSPRKKK